MRQALRRSLLTCACLLLPAVARAGSIEIDDAAGVPGSSVEVVARLRDMGRPVVATQNDIQFTTAAPIAARPGGEPDCDVNPAIDKVDSGFRFQPEGCGSDLRCTAVRALVLSLSNIDRIQDGAVLYTCRVAIPATAASGSYALRVSDVVLVDPDGEEIPAPLGIDGSVVVDGDPLVLYLGASESVRLLDPETSEVLFTVELPERPTYLSLSPDGSTLLATAESEAIYVIDTATLSVRSQILDQPRYAGSAFAPDGTLAYAVRYLADPPSSLSLIDLATDQVMGSIPLAPDIYARIAVSPDGRTGYVPRLLHPQFSGLDVEFDITVIDLDSGEIETTIPIPCGRVMYDLAFSPDGSRLYVPVGGSDLCDPGAGGGAPACIGDCNGDGGVLIDELIRGVNIALGLAALDTCAGFAGGDGAVEIQDLIGAVNAALGGCVEPPPRGDFTAVVDTATQSVITVIDLGAAAAPGLRAQLGAPAGVEARPLEGLGIELSIDGRLAYVTGCQDGMCVVDLVANEVVGTVELPHLIEVPSGEQVEILPLDIEVTPDGRRAYVSATAFSLPPESVLLPEFGRLTVIDLERLEVIDSFFSPGAADPVIGPMPIVCPVDFLDDNTEDGASFCLYSGPYSTDCPDDPLSAAWVSDGETVAITFVDFDDVTCFATVDGANTATLTSCAIDGDEFDVDGTLTLGTGGTTLTMDAPEGTFQLGDCVADLYEGGLDEVLILSSGARHP